MKETMDEVANVLLDLGIFKSDVAAYWNSKGCEYYAKGDYDIAITCYENAIKFNSNIAIYWNNKGSAYYYKGNYGEALLCYKKAEDLDKDDIYVLSSMAILLIMMKDFNGAKQILERKNIHQSFVFIIVAHALYEYSVDNHQISGNHLKNIEDYYQSPLNAKRVAERCGVYICLIKYFLSEQVLNRARFYLDKICQLQPDRVDLLELKLAVETAEKNKIQSELDASKRENIELKEKLNKKEDLSVVDVLKQENELLKNNNLDLSSSLDEAVVLLQEKTQEVKLLAEIVERKDKELQDANKKISSLNEKLSFDIRQSSKKSSAVSFRVIKQRFFPLESKNPTNNFNLSTTESSFEKRLSQ